MTAVAPRVTSTPRGSTLLALLERLVNRGASALVTFGMALFVSPEAAGAYAFGMLALTFAQAIGESVLRQIGVAAWRYTDGGQSLRRISALTGWGGAVFVVLAESVAWLAGLYPWSQLLLLLPLAVVAFMQGYFAPNITLAQYHGHWGRLTRAQSIGGVLSILVAVPLLPFAGIAAGVLQSVIAEGYFAARAGRGLEAPEPDRERVDIMRRFFYPTVVSNVFGWFNGQADRLVVTVLAGAGPLGLLSLALAVAKTATDAVLSGIMNVLRSRLAAAQNEAERIRAFTQVVTQALGIAGGLQIVVSILSIWPLRELLKPEWHPALAVVPLLAMSGLPMAAHYSIAASAIDAGRAKTLRTVNVVSLVVAIAVGVTLSFSLPIGATAEAIGDVIALGVMYPLMSHHSPRALTVRIWGMVAAGFAFGIGMYVLQASLA